METLSLHILDIVENSIRAGATTVMIELVEDERRDLLKLSVSDNGKGMDALDTERADNPFFTTKKGKGVGLGLALLSQAGREAGGGITVESKEGVGTRIEAVFKRSHPDTKPIGNVEETMAVLVAGHPDIRFIYARTTSEGTCHFDSHRQ